MKDLRQSDERSCRPLTGRSQGRNVCVHNSRRMQKKPRNPGASSPQHPQDATPAAPAPPGDEGTQLIQDRGQAVGTLGGGVGSIWRAVFTVSANFERVALSSSSTSGSSCLPLCRQLRRPFRPSTKRCGLPGSWTAASAAAGSCGRAVRRAAATASVCPCDKA